MSENGRLQAVLDCINVPYTGSNYFGSALAMDKNISKTLFVQYGIPTADWLLFDPKKDSVEKVKKEIGFPCAVKPTGCGSSCGVSLVHNDSEWKAAIDYSTKYEDICLIEKMVSGREFSIGILEGKALPIIVEANNLPGMTPNSLLPQEARAIGISYEDLCERLVMNLSPSQK